MFAVRYLAVFGYLVSGDEENGVGSFDTLIVGSLIAYSLGQSAKIIGHAVEPQGAVRASEKHMIVCNLASCFVDDTITV